MMELRMRRYRTSRSAFSLIEVLVVISIIALLVAILIPAVTNARRIAQQVACGQNLHALGWAVFMYLEDNHDVYWPFYHDVPEGRYWWFGFEEDGPGSGTDRPLDKSLAKLAPYQETTDNRLQCPSFPYGHDRFRSKFIERSASYGYNINIAERPRIEFLTRETQVFVFADGAHFDFGNAINEGHYISYVEEASAPSGYGHYRHRGRANVLYMGGHVLDQPLRGPAYWVQVAGQSGNLTDEFGSNAIYGF